MAEPIDLFIGAVLDVAAAAPILAVLYGIARIIWLTATDLFKD